MTPAEQLDKLILDFIWYMNDSASLICFREDDKTEIVKHKSRYLYKTNIWEIDIWNEYGINKPFSAVNMLNRLYQLWYEVKKSSDFSKKAMKKADSFWSNKVIISQFVKWIKGHEKLKEFVL